MSELTVLTIDPLALGIGGVLLIASVWFFATRESFAQQLARFYGGMHDPFWVPRRLRYHPGISVTRVMSFVFAIATLGLGIGFLVESVR